MKRFFVAAPAAFLLAASLVSCESGVSGSDENPETAVGECVQPGSVSDSITVDGDFGEEITLTTNTPIKVSDLERSVLIEGEGEELVQGELYRSYITMINGANGDILSSGIDSLQLDGPYHEAIRASLECSVVGDRIGVVLTAADLYGPGNAQQMGPNSLNDDDGVVIVIDFMTKNEILEKAEGTEIELPSGAPDVSVDDKGEPTITFPKSINPPKALTVHKMVEGEGPVVGENDSVIVHYRGVIWRTGEEFDSSWSRGEPATFAVGGVIDGFKKALEGETVGSRMLTLVPADDGGYGPDWLVSNGYEEDDVMVFVLDILGVA